MTNITIGVHITILFLVISGFFLQLEQKFVEEVYILQEAQRAFLSSKVIYNNIS